MDRLHFQTGRDVPPADYVVEVVCRGDAEPAVRALTIEAVSGPDVQVKSLASTDAETPGEIGLRAEMSAARRTGPAGQATRCSRGR
jgi:putative Mg2+ transporter-C (MgtC) family protein